MTANNRKIPGEPTIAEFKTSLRGTLLRPARVKVARRRGGTGHDED